MINISSLITKLRNCCEDTYWNGGCSQAQIDQLEGLLDSKLPDSFRMFLEECGGGGVACEEISGICDNNPTSMRRGTILGDTDECRREHALPPGLVVIYYRADEVVWCLDINNFDANECPVVAYDIYLKSTHPIADSFLGFFEEYVALHSAE